MPQTNLDHAIQEALERLNNGKQGGRTADPPYIDAFKTSARRKAETVLGFLKDGTFPANKPVFVSVGGGDGEELAHLLENSTATDGVLLELSDAFADRARNRKLRDGKRIRVVQGSAQARIAEAMEYAAHLVRQGCGDALIITCHAVIHEMYDRGDIGFDDLGFFGPIFKYPDLPTGFTYREPGDIEGWPDELLVSADCDPESLLKLAEAIRGRHEALKKLTPAPQTIAGESLRVHRTLGLELLAKLFYLEDLPHEIEERSTSIDHDRLNNAIHTAIGDRARFENRAVSQTQGGPTGSFVEKWKRMKVRIETRQAGKPKEARSVPEFQKRMIVWRDARTTPDAHNAISPVTATPIADFDPKHRVVHVPYQVKGERVVGRDESLLKVRDQLTKGRRTVIGQTAAFNGLGGLGKTQLAVEYAWQYGDEYRNGVIWIEADQDIDAQLTAIAVKARWVGEASEHRYKLDVALKRLRSFSDCLVIFDNVEQLEAIERYLPEPGVFPHLLLTSREPQKGFESVSLKPLDAEQSLQLLLQEAGRRPTSPHDAAAAQAIAQRLDGLPLAIEIAGAYLHEMPATTFAEFWQLLDRDPHLHAGRDYLASFTGHEADLDSALQISSRVMQKQPRLEAVLDLLTWSGAAAMGTSLMSAMLDVEPVELLEPLAFGARLHVIKEERDEALPLQERRFRIHRLVRDLRRAKEPLKGRAAWAATILERTTSWFKDRRVDFSHLSSYESEIDHLRAWQEHAKTFAPDQAAELLWLEAYPAWHRGNYVRSKGLLDNAVELLKPSQRTVELQAHLMNDLGAVVGLLGDYRRAREYAE